MLHLNSFKLLNNDSICKSIEKSYQRKIKKRLKELNDLLGFEVKENVTNSGSAFHSPTVNYEKIIAIEWNVNFDALNIILSNGLIAWLFFDPFDYTSLTYIYLDKYLIGKIKTLYIVDVIFHHSKILISYTNSTVTCVQFNHAQSLNSVKFQKNFKLKSQNVKIFEFDLEINCNVRRVEKHLLLDKYHNEDETLLAVWWQNGSNALCSWSSPASSSKDLSNIFIYKIFEENFQLISFDSIPTDILKISFSKSKPYHLLTIEDEQKPKTLAFKAYQISHFETGNGLTLITSEYITIPSQFLKVEFNLSLDKVLILCEEKTIILFNINQNSILFFKAPINAIEIINNPLDSFFVISDNSGQIMMYDYGLHVMSANYDDLFTREAFGSLSSIKFLNGSLLCLKFNESPSLTLITLPNNLNYIRLIAAYVKNDYINEALENLQSLDWNINSYLAYSSLSIIFNHLIKEPLNPLKESQLELALASFFIPTIPINEEITAEYQEAIHSLSKKFFFHLYRYSCLEKAFLLALDLNSRHLFLLLYKIGKERGNSKLAQVALQNISKLNNSIQNRTNCNNLQSKNQVYCSNSEHSFPYLGSYQYKTNNNTLTINEINKKKLWPSIDQINHQMSTLNLSQSNLISSQNSMYLSPIDPIVIENYPKQNLTEFNCQKNSALNKNFPDLARNQDNFHLSYHHNLPPFSAAQTMQNMIINTMSTNLTTYQQKEPSPVSFSLNTSLKLKPESPIVLPNAFTSKQVPPPLPPKTVSSFYSFDKNQTLKNYSNLSLPAYDVETFQKDNSTLIPIEIKTHLKNNIKDNILTSKCSSHYSQNVSTSSNSVITHLDKDGIKKNLKIECIHFGFV